MFIYRYQSLQKTANFNKWHHPSSLPITIDNCLFKRLFLINISILNNFVDAVLLKCLRLIQKLKYKRND